MVVFEWFLRAGQVIAPDDKFQETTEEETPDQRGFSLTQILAPDPNFHPLAAAKETPQTTIREHCHKETRITPLPSKFATPVKQKVDTTPSSNHDEDNRNNDDNHRGKLPASASLVVPAITSVDQISPEMKRVILQASIDTSQMQHRDKVYLDKLNSLHSQLMIKTSQNSTSRKILGHINRIKTLLDWDEDNVKAGGLSLRLGRAYMVNVIGIDLSYTPLHIAARHGNIAAMVLLLEKMSSEQLQSRTFLGQTALHVAANYGETSAVEYLEPLYDANETDLVGRTAFRTAVASPVSKAQQNKAELTSRLYSQQDPTNFLSNSKSHPVEPWESNLGVVVAVANFIGQRGENEDAHEIKVWMESKDEHELEQYVGFACICDGHEDKARVAEYVAKNLPLALTMPQAAKEPWPERFQIACHAVDDELKKEKPPMNGGCTAIAAVLTPTEIVVANVGDCRCILIQKGATPEKDLTEAMASLSLDEPLQSFTLTAMSKDHKLEGDELERMRKAGAPLAERNLKNKEGQDMTKYSLTCSGQFDAKHLNMARSFGDFDFKEAGGLICTPDVQTRPRDADRDMFLVLACDGVWDVKSNEEVARMVLEEVSKKSEINAGTLNEVAETLCKDCFDSGDNVSVVILSLKDAKVVVPTPQNVLPLASDVQTPQKIPVGKADPSATLPSQVNESPIFSLEQISLLDTPDATAPRKVEVETVLVDEASTREVTTGL